MLTLRDLPSLYEAPQQMPANEGPFRGTFRCIPPKESCLLETVDGDTAARKIRTLLFDAEGNRIPGVCTTM